MNHPVSDADAYERARRRVQELRGLYTHIALFIVLSLVQFAIDFFQGAEGINWAYWSFFGWGAGVAVHAWTVLGQTVGREWERKKIAELVARERERDASLLEKAEPDSSPDATPAATELDDEF